MPQVYRQGDVVFRKVDAGSLSLASFYREDCKIAGETGKMHVVNAPLYRSGSTFLVLVKEPTPVEHPDHETIVLPPGVYEIRNTRRYVGPFGRSRSGGD